MSYFDLQKKYEKQELQLQLALIDYKQNSSGLSSVYKNVPIALYEELKKSQVIDYTVYRTKWRGKRGFSFYKSYRTGLPVKEWDHDTKRVNADFVDLYRFSRDQIYTNRVKEEAYQRGVLAGKKAV